LLLQRVLTALVLLPFVLGTLWFGSTTIVTAVFGAVAMLALLEWAALTGIRAGHGRAAAVPPAVTALYVGTAIALMAAVVLLRGTPFVWVLVAGTCAWWVVALRWIATYPSGFDATTPPRWVKAGAGLLVVPGTIASIGLLHGSPDGALRLLFGFVLVWAADVGAYFAGRAFGSRKLAPNVSPGKTWEGVYGGMALALVFAAIGGEWLFHVQDGAWVPFLLLCAAVVMFSIVGDLGESLLKRMAGAKDSGTLLPGHGGMLDRIDSLLAALPALAVGLRWLGL
jgi:phosphatidate cytidylyltransferase